VGIYYIHSFLSLKGLVHYVLVLKQTWLSLTYSQENYPQVHHQQDHRNQRI